MSLRRPHPVLLRCSGSCWIPAHDGGSDTSVTPSRRCLGTRVKGVFLQDPGSGRRDQFLAVGAAAEIGPFLVSVKLLKQRLFLF